MVKKVHLPVIQTKMPPELDAPLSLPAYPQVTADLPLIDSRPAGTAPYRASSYNIYVDLPRSAEEMLLVHAYSGAYDRVSRRVATYVRSLEVRHAPRPLYGEWTPEPTTADGEVPHPSDKTIMRLRQRGYLTQMTPAEEEAYFCHIAAALHQVALRQRPGFILMPTYQCNLRCAYCFQDHMRTDPAHGHLLRLMSYEMVDRIFKGMDHIEATHGVPPGGRGRNITLFGGEPLLGESRPLIEYILGKALATGDASISAISNATDLDAYADLLGPQGIQTIQVTLDGPPDEHDRRRIYADGSGSFARIARNITMALQRETNISLRMNIDRANIVHLPRLAEEFVRQGWTGHPRFSAYVAPINAVNDNVDSKSTFDSWELGLAMGELGRLHPVVHQITSHDHSMIDRARDIFEMRSDPLPHLKADFCSAHNTMYVLDAFGDIYACWERTGDPRLRIGSITETGEVRVSSALIDMWRRRNVTSNIVCRKCRYATYCGGGCAVLAEGVHGTVFSNHCDGFAKRFRANVATAYLDHITGVPRVRAADLICDL